MTRFDDREAYIRYVTSLDEVVPKDDFVVELGRGRTVLDLGCIDHSYEIALDLGENWLHARLKNVASRLVGVDLLAADARELNRLGYDIRVEDVESMDLGSRFDLVVAGDLIEHLSNVGRFLETAGRHMHPRSLMVITTPNPFNIEQFAKALFRNTLMVNPEHTAWFDPRVMFETVARSPLAIVDFKWIDTRFHFALREGRILRHFVNRVSSALMAYRPILRRDFAVLLQLRESATETPPAAG